MVGEGARRAPPDGQPSPPHPVLPRHVTLQHCALPFRRTVLGYTVPPLQSNWTPLTLCKEPSSSPRCRLRIDRPRLPNHPPPWLERYRVRGQDSAVCDRVSVLV